MPSSTAYLVADVGGTNTRLALASRGGIDESSIKRFKNGEYGDLISVIQTYLDVHNSSSRIAGLCVAMAGPVHDGIGKLTNLSWTIDQHALADTLSLDRVAVINDLQAQGHAISGLKPDVLTPLLPGTEGARSDTKLVIGVGTGFNACPVFSTDSGSFVPPSEVGHVSLPASLPGFQAVVQAATALHGYPAIEELLSGRGLSFLHKALNDIDLAPSDIMAAIEAGDAKALQTGRAFAQILGEVAGALALTYLPFAGIYLVGGVSRSMAPYLDEFGFAKSFLSKGRFSGFMTQFSVWAVEDDYAALAGCAAHLNQI